MCRLIIIFSIAIFVSCNNGKKFHSHDTGLEIVKPGEQYLESKIINFKSIGFADTILSNISGHVHTAYIFKGKEFNESMAAGWITLINQSTCFRYHAYFDKVGFYKLYIEPGNYNIVFKSISYNNIEIDSILFRPGEIKQLDVQLAASGPTGMLKIFKWMHEDSLIEKRGLENQ